MPKVWNKRDPNVPKDAVYVRLKFMAELEIANE